MRITQIRNATVIIEYADKRFLVDPMLSDKETMKPFTSLLHPFSKNPLVDLPFGISRIIDVDSVIVTHLHPDHFDHMAAEVIPKHLPMFVQNENDKNTLSGYGFTNITVLTEHTAFGGIELIKVPGQHGTWNVEKLTRLGSVCGVIMCSEKEKTLYITGDTIWYEAVEHTLQAYQPGVILANAGQNDYGDYQLVMGTDDILQVHKALPGAQIIATHMEDVNHWTLSRKDLRRFSEEHGFSSKLFIPQNGETYFF